MELLNSIGISQPQLVQVGLDLLGYFAASALTLLLYASYFSRRNHKTAQLRHNNIPGENLLAERAVATTAEKTDVSFMSFGAGRSPKNEMVDVSPKSEATSQERVSASHHMPHENAGEFADSATSRFTRNRTEVIRLARKMLDAGNSPDRVADLLPLSESEMQLVRLGAGSERQ